MKSQRDKPITPIIVLVVEDEPTRCRELAESIVEHSGYRILAAATAREGIARLEKDEPIDSLFTDIHLPDGPDAVDGLEVARQAVQFRRKREAEVVSALVERGRRGFLRPDGAPLPSGSHFPSALARLWNFSIPKIVSELRVAVLAISTAGIK